MSLQRWTNIFEMELLVSTLRKPLKSWECLTLIGNNGLKGGGDQRSCLDRFLSSRRAWVAVIALRAKERTERVCVCEMKRNENIKKIKTFSNFMFIQ